MKSPGPDPTPSSSKSKAPVPEPEQGAPVVMEVVRDAEKFSLLREEWNELAEKSSATIFQTHEWLFLWWKYFGSAGGRTLHIVVFRQNGTLAGVLPLFLDAQTLLGFRLYKRLRLLGCGVANRNSHTAMAEAGPSDFLDFIVLPQFRPTVVRMFVRFLQEHSFLYDELDLVNVREEGIAKTELLACLDELGIPYKTTRLDICPWLKTPPSVDLYLKGLNPHVRRRLTQAKKALAGVDNYAMEIVSPDNLRGAFDDLVSLHQTRWNRLGYPGSFHEARFKSFAEEMIRSCLDHGWIWFKTVQLEGIRIAARLAFCFNGSIFDYFTGFDDRSPGSKHRPGLAILLSQVEDAVTRKYRSVELLRGDEAYKFEMTSDATYIWEVRFFNPKTSGSLRVRAAQGIRFVNHIVHVLLKEWMLLGVHLRQHGFLLGVARYAAFRYERLTHALFPRKTVAP
jgi:CelD/BcsL family acetyltransferase involved in cellulose biosynthesis